MHLEVRVPFLGPRREHQNAVVLVLHQHVLQRAHRDAGLSLNGKPVLSRAVKPRETEGFPVPPIRLLFGDVGEQVAFGFVCHPQHRRLRRILLPARHSGRLPLIVSGDRQIQIRLADRIDPERPHRVEIGVLSAAPRPVRVLRDGHDLLTVANERSDVGQVLFHAKPQRPVRLAGQLIGKRHHLVDHHMQPSQVRGGVHRAPLLLERTADDADVPRRTPGPMLVIVCEHAVHERQKNRVEERLVLGELVVVQHDRANLDQSVDAIVGGDAPSPRVHQLREHETVVEVGALHMGRPRRRSRRVHVEEGLHELVVAAHKHR